MAKVSKIDQALEGLKESKDIVTTIDEIIKYNDGDKRNKEIENLATSLKRYRTELEIIKKTALEVVKTYSKPIGGGEITSELVSQMIKTYLGNTLQDTKNKLEETTQFVLSDYNEAKKIVEQNMKMLPEIGNLMKKAADATVNKNSPAVKFKKSDLTHKTTPEKAKKHVSPSNNPNSLDKKTINAAFKKMEESAKRAGGVLARGRGKDSNKYYFVPKEALGRVTNTRGGARIDKKYTEGLIQIDYMPVKEGYFVEHGNKKAANYSAYIDNSGNVKMIPLPQEYLSDMADASEEIFKEFSKDKDSQGMAKWRADKLKEGIMDKASVMSTNKYDLEKDEYGTSSEIQKFFKANNVQLHTFIKNLFERSAKLVKKGYENNGRNRDILETQIVRAIYIKALDISDDLKQKLLGSADMAELVHSGAFEEIEPYLDQLVNNFDFAFGASSEESISHRVIGLIDNDEAFFGAELSAMLRKVIQTAKVAKKKNAPKMGYRNEVKGSSDKIDQSGPQHQRYPVLGVNDEILAKAREDAKKKMEAAKNEIEAKIKRLEKASSKMNKHTASYRLQQKQIAGLEAEAKRIEEEFYTNFGHTAASVDDDQSLIVSTMSDELTSFINKTVEITNDEIDQRVKAKDLKQKNAVDTLTNVRQNAMAEAEYYRKIGDFETADEYEADANVALAKLTDLQSEFNVWETLTKEERRKEAIKDILEKEYGHIFNRETSENLTFLRDAQSGVTEVKFDYVSFMDENTKLGIGARRTQGNVISPAYARQIIRTMFGIPDDVSDQELDKYGVAAFVYGDSVGYNDLALALNEAMPGLIIQYKKYAGLNQDATGWEDGFIDYLKNNSVPGAIDLANLLEKNKTGGLSIKPGAVKTAVKSGNIETIKNAFDAVLGSVLSSGGLEDDPVLRNLKYSTINILETLPINPNKNAKMNDQARKAITDVGGAIGMADYSNKLVRAYMPSEEDQAEYEMAKEAISAAALLSGQSGTDTDTIKDRSVSIGYGAGYDVDIQKALSEITDEKLWDSDGKIRNPDAVAQTIWGQIEAAKELKLAQLKKNNPNSNLTTSDIGAYFDLSGAPLTRKDAKGREYKINRLYVPNIPIKRNADGTYMLPQEGDKLRALMGAIATFNDPNKPQDKERARVAIGRHAEDFLIGQENARDRGYYYELGTKGRVRGSQQFHGRGVNIAEMATGDSVENDINLTGFQTNRETFLRNLRDRAKTWGNNASKIQKYQKLLNELTFGQDDLAIKENLDATDENVGLLENRIADYITLRSKYFDKLQYIIREEAIKRATRKDGTVDEKKRDALIRKMRARGVAADMLRWPLTNRMDVRGTQWFINEDAKLSDTEFMGMFAQRVASNMDFDSDTISTFLNPLAFEDPEESRKYIDKQREIYMRAAPRLMQDRLKKMRESSLIEGKPLSDSAFAALEQEELNELTNLFAKHYKEGVGSVSNLSVGISNMIDAAGLGTVHVGGTKEEQLQAAKALIARNMMEGVEQNMISAKHAIKLLVTNGGISEEEGNKRIASLFQGAHNAFNTLSTTGSLPEFFKTMREAGVFGADKNDVLDSRISAVTMSAIQGFSNGEWVLKQLLGDNYKKIVHGDAADYGKFSADVVANAVGSIQTGLEEHGISLKDFNRRVFSRTGTGGETNAANFWDRYGSQYGRMIGQNTGVVNNLTEATERLEDAIYSEAEAEKYKISIAKKEGEAYDDNIQRLRDLKDATKQLDKAHRIAEAKAKGENPYNPSVTTMLRNAFGGNEYPDLTGFRVARDQLKGTFVGDQLETLYGEELYKKYAESEGYVSFGNVTHAVKQAINKAQEIGYTGDTYSGMVSWLKKEKDTNIEAQALWDEFLKKEDPDTHEHGVFDLIKETDRAIKKQSKDKEDYERNKENIVTNAIYAGESLNRGSQIRAQRNGQQGFVQSEVNLGGVIDHAQHGRADTIVGSFGGKRWDDALQKFVDDPNMATIEVQDIKTHEHTNLTAKDAMQPVLYAYYLKQAQDYIKDNDITDFSKFNGAQNPLKAVGMDIDEKLFNQLKSGAEITAAVQTYNQKTGQYITRRASIDKLLNNANFMAVLQEVVDAGRFNVGGIDKADYHYVTDPFVESSEVGETGIDPHAQNKIKRKKQEKEATQREQDEETAKKNYVELLKQELALEKEIAEFKQKHGDSFATGSNEDVWLKYKGQLLSAATSQREAAGNKYAGLGGNPEEIRQFYRAQAALAAQGSSNQPSQQPKQQNLLESLGYGKGGGLTRMITQYFSLYRVLGKVRQTMQKVITITKQLDQAATNIRIVTGKEREEVDNLILSYSKLASQIGSTTAAVAESANTWLRQGYNINEVNKLITASTQLSKLGMLDINSATKVLTSTLKGFKMEASEATSVVDKFTKLDTKFAASAGEIGEALSRAASLAQQSGMSLDQASAFVTTIMDITQQSAEMAGTSLRTILARYGNVKAGSFVNADEDDVENINDIEKVLSRIGITIRSSNSDMRAFSDVLDDISEKWLYLTDVEKNAIATAVAGELAPEHTEMCA